MIEPPFSTSAEVEDFSKEADASRLHQEDILLWRLCISISGRHHNSFDPQPHDKVQEIGNLLRCYSLIKGAVDRDPKPFPTSQLDALRCRIEYPLAASQSVMPLPVAVQMDGKGEVGRRGIVLDAGTQQESVGAKIDKLSPSDKA